MQSGNKSFVAANICGLCRNQFISEAPEGVDVWQSMFRAVMLIDSNDEKSIQITDAINLTGSHDETDIHLLGRPPSELVTICRSQQLYKVERSLNGPAFGFHDWCYSILMGKLKRFSKHTTKSIIYKLVRSLLPSSSVWKNICEARQQLDPTSSLHMLVAHADAYPELQPIPMLSLPRELRERIWKFVGVSTPSSAAIIVAGHVSSLIPSLKSRPPYDLALKQQCFLSIETIRVFGVDYIRSLVTKKSPVGTSIVIGDVKGLKFASSLCGICAIKLVGVDTETDWLGNIPGTGYVWYGIMRDDVIPSLCFINNDLNCVNISEFGLGTVGRVLWDKPSIPSTLTDPDAALFDYKRDFIGSSRSDILNHDIQFLRYLSLYNDIKYISGLTVYHSTSGIVGLEAHFMQISQLSGCRDGCALYFPLCPEERIAYTWLRIVNSSVPVIYRLALTIQTTLGRTHTFGPHILPGLVKEAYKWVFLESKGCVAGFYYENPIANITRLGIIDDSCSPMAPPIAPQYPRVFSPFPGPTGGIFLSIASLCAFERVDLCRISNRCIGILIHYINGQSAVLGQWRHESIASHSCIFDNDSTSYTNIYFTMTLSGQHKLVTDVTFSEDFSKLGPETEYHIFDLNQEIVWWFSETWDAILPWSGDWLDIPDDSKGVFT